MLKANKIEIKGKIKIVYTDNGTYVLKPKTRNVEKNILPYLKSRKFEYFPEIIEENSDYIIMPYLEDYDIPKEQKMIDLIELLGLLHSKTTHYKDVTEDDYKEIYEDLSNNILYLQSYYEDMIAYIENKVYYSPKEYLLARNITKIFSSLYFCKQELTSWYNMVKEKREKRLTVIHNNLRLDHFIRNEKSYFISLDKAKVDLPVFDFYKLYYRHILEYDFNKLFKKYNKIYPLMEDEKKLLFILVSLPDKIEFGENEYENVLIVSKMIDKLYKSEHFISPYYSKEGEKNKT